jgi:hypothetical protein
MEKTKIDLMEDHLRKIEDIKNSCASLVEKVGHLQVDLFNDPDKDLEKALDKLNNDFSNDHQYITEVWHAYEEKIKELKK